MLNLVGAKAELTVEPDRIVGRIGGAVTGDELDEVVIPIFVEGLNRIVARNCNELGCTNGSAGQEVLGLFDANEDGVIEVEELRGNDLVRSLLAPDLDLFDEDGTLNPRCDGIKDSLSVGIGFTAVPAVVGPNPHPTQTRPESERAGN